MKFLRFAATGLLALCAAVEAQEEKFAPVNFSDVTIDSQFWSPRLETNRRVSIPHNLQTCEETGRIDNFRHLAGVSAQAPFQGHIFHDSDVYKVLEGVAYSLHTHPDPKLEKQLDEIIELVRRCQQPDGYVNTWFTFKEPDKRWSNLQHAHELYCAGHMFEAAVAHYRATGRRTFLDVACKFADYIDTVFGPGKRHGIAGHPEIELALVKLWRATGEPRYLELARFFVEEHGNEEHRELFGAYCQDHKPVREQTEPMGHAVRFLYFYSAVADLAALDDDAGYIETMQRLWNYIVDKKMYVTGGVGVQGHGEGFARAYYLPNYEAYCETCASIGMVFWNHRLALLHGDSRYADLVERLLYNGALSGISLDGANFFYVNPLASRGGHHRQPWYGCACCPTNVVRFIASLGQYIYATQADGDGFCMLQYVGGTAELQLKSNTIRVTQETQYPWEGQVAIAVHPEHSSEFAIKLRIPAWSKDAEVHVNGQPVDVVTQKGFLAIRRLWSAGDTITLDLPMPVRQVRSDPQVEANVGRRAIIRGPVVYCLEDVDNPCPVDQVAIAEGAEFEIDYRPALLGGVSTLTTQGQHHGVVETEEGFAIQQRNVTLRAVPYYAWDNRDASKMVVWIPTQPPAAGDLEDATLAVVARITASHCHASDATSALNDCALPENSNDHEIPRFTWWDHRGGAEWVAYEFEQPKTISCAEVYWFDDTGRGACRVPASWKLQWKDGNQWKPVRALSDYGVEQDQFNRVSFEPVTTTALRIDVQLQPRFSGGILEWRLPE
jgi:DUF1680 family protein